MQEAATISKAIELGWVKAGKPTEFSVKIFEQPEKNFFGFSKNLAKIGIFFVEGAQKQQREGGQRHNRAQTAQRQPKRPYQGHPQKTEPKTTNRKVENKPTARTISPKPAIKRVEQKQVVRNHAPKTNPIKTENRPVKKVENKPVARSAEPNTTTRTAPEQKKPAKTIWTEEMTSIARAWIQEALKISKQDYIKIVSFVENKKLTISLDKPILEDRSKENLLFRSFSSLIMQSLRTKYKKEFYGFNIIITSQ